MLGAILKDTRVRPNTRPWNRFTKKQLRRHFWDPGQLGLWSRGFPLRFSIQTPASRVSAGQGPRNVSWEGKVSCQLSIPNGLLNTHCYRNSPLDLWAGSGIWFFRSPVLRVPYTKAQTSHSEISQVTTLRRPKCSIINRFIFIFPCPLHAIALKLVWLHESVCRYTFPMCPVAQWPKQLLLGIFVPRWMPRTYSDLMKGCLDVHFDGVPQWNGQNNYYSADPFARNGSEFTLKAQSCVWMYISMVSRSGMAKITTTPDPFARNGS